VKNSEALPVHVVTDSVADIPEPLIQKHNIDIVRAKFSFSAEEDYTDGDISMSEFLIKLAEHPLPPTTASPGIDVFKTIYEAHPEPIAAVYAGSKLSAIYGIGLKAAEQLHRKNIEIFDSKSASLGIGFPALLAAEMAEQGLTLAEIKPRVEDMIERTYVIALLHELKYLQHGGRMSLSQFWAGSLLGIKPIIEVYDNKVSKIDQARTKKNALPLFLTWIQDRGPFERMGIVHAANPEGAKEVQNALSNDFDKDKMLVADLTTALSAHVGPGTVGVVFVATNKPSKR
jgi:DegV family protein with EDD domain